MCCLFGIFNYSGKADKELNYLINCLAREATARGTDSTGIAYNKDGKLKIYKKPLSAFDMNFDGIENCISISGHTRHATQGSEQKNYNNHPFMGYCDNVKFALSHNGILWNDALLRKNFGIEKNKIDTDSYIAVQLLEHFGTLNFANIKTMAESVKGSFAFTMTDTLDNLWLVKGDSPLSIIHFPDLKMYVYASTENILFAALSKTDFLSEIISGDYEIINIKQGDIFKIDKSGNISQSTFDFDCYDDFGYYDWRTYGTHNKNNMVSEFDDDNDTYDYDKHDITDIIANFNDEQLQYYFDLKMIANYYGIDEDYVDMLLCEGFSLDDIEMWLYDEYDLVG